jgi:dolichol-phosphate mannosyltransferase
VASLRANLVEMERTRESYWRRFPATSPVKLHWRALVVRHCFHLLSGESVLEIGAGSGLWTEHLAEVFRGENHITAAVFNDDLAELAEARRLSRTRVVRVTDLLEDLPAETFDYVVGTAILCHDRYGENLSAIRRLLKPGGQLLFFEANFWNPQVLLKNAIPAIGRRAGQASCQIGMRRYRLLEETSRRGFVEVNAIPYDIVHARTPPALIPPVQSTAFVLEHMPGVRDLSGTLYIWAKKPGDETPSRPRVDLAEHQQLFGSTSVVVPCHNEAMNVSTLVRALLDMYDRYIHEIVLVDDNSTDDTPQVAAALARAEPRVKVVTRRDDPGVGRALRDGYRAATGEYILSMDCDFAMLVPELRDLFDAVAAGHEGAIGSRFSHDSILVNYPVKKILGNRGFHLLARALLGLRMRDISNNLKLYRASILKEIEIEQPGFAANVETGLKPLLAGHDIVEVPISWINRTPTMGSSSFDLAKVAPGYAQALARLVRETRTRRNGASR